MAQGVYWVGQDGNLYSKQAGVSGGVINRGSVADTGFAEAPIGSTFYADGMVNELIRDPSLSGSKENTDPDLITGNTTGDGGDAARKRAIMQAAISGIDQNINSLDDRRDNTIQGVRNNFSGILKQYADQEAQTRSKYEKETDANEGRFSRNQSLALQSAATGRQGLMATLASIGAVGPTALNLADRAVARSANLDLGEAGRTFESNATSLTEGYDKVRQDEENRRNEAIAARDADIQAAQYDYLEQLQKAYQQKANTYAQGEAVDQAKTFTSKAGDLFSQLAAKTKPVTAKYQTRDIGLDTSNLQNYLAGQRRNSVRVAGDAGASAMNSPIYAISRRKEELV